MARKDRIVSEVRRIWDGGKLRDQGLAIEAPRPGRVVLNRKTREPAEVWKCRQEWWLPGRRHPPNRGDEVGVGPIQAWMLTLRSLGDTLRMQPLAELVEAEVRDDFVLEERYAHARGRGHEGPLAFRIEAPARGAGGWQQHATITIGEWAEPYVARAASPLEASVDVAMWWARWCLGYLGDIEP